MIRKMATQQIMKTVIQPTEKDKCSVYRISSAVNFSIKLIAFVSCNKISSSSLCMNGFSPQDSTIFKIFPLPLARLTLFHGLDGGVAYSELLHGPHLSPVVTSLCHMPMPPSSLTDCRWWRLSSLSPGDLRLWPQTSLSPQRP